jgi:hypothetical protein
MMASKPVKPTDRTLADMWESYARAVIPPGTSAAAIKNNQFAFYGGASYVLDVLVAIGDADVELRLFALQQGAVVKPGN